MFFPSCLQPLDFVVKNGAGDGIRTHDFNLGKVALYPWATPALYQTFVNRADHKHWPIHCKVYVPAQKKYSRTLSAWRLTNRIGPMSATQQELIKRLEHLGIDTETISHPAVYTVEEAKALRGRLPGAHSKNLFLKDKKNCFWLVVTLEDKTIDLKV